MFYCISWNLVMVYGIPWTLDMVYCIPWNLEMVYSVTWTLDMVYCIPWNLEMVYGLPWTLEMVYWLQYTLEQGRVKNYVKPETKMFMSLSIFVIILQFTFRVLNIRFPRS